AAGAVDVLVMSQRERATDLAVLRATGWTTRELARLTLYEGLGLALLGSLTGAAAGLATVLALGEGVLSGHLLPVAAAAGTAILVSTGLVCAALAVPIRTLTRDRPCARPGRGLIRHRRQSPLAPGRIHRPRTR
ncbi:FtsX-like permease family protein, partial [Streptomyces sp. NPDC001537]